MRFFIVSIFAFLLFVTHGHAETDIENAEWEITVPEKRPLIRGDQPMSSDNIRLYKKIFEFQLEHEWEKADRYITKLTDLRLRGHVLKQRYLHPLSYKSTYFELSTWMDFYHDLPNASRVYELALKRKPSSESAPKRPTIKYGLQGNLGISFNEYKENYTASKRRNSQEANIVKKYKAQLREDLKNQAPSRALDRLNSASYQAALDPIEVDIIKGRIALSYFYLARLDKALDVGEQAADRSGTKAGLAAWIAGLANWRKGNYESAARYFDMAANGDHLSPWTASASAYWASRAYWRLRQPEKVNVFLEQAAKHTHTFYGMIARRALGYPMVDYDWSVPKFKSSHEELLKEFAEYRRASLLLSVGQIGLAESELARLHPRDNQEVRQALLAYAFDKGFAALALRLATAIEHPNGGLYYGVSYPVGAWIDDDDYKLDKALVHAFIRQESRFNPFAESGSGATGLMQLMPATASFISGQDYKGKKSFKLLNPKLNVTLGQQYLKSLLSTSEVNGDLFKLMIAYNAGPGNLRRWLNKIDHDNDPLFFIESIPVAETRGFVELVSVNLWMYRQRFGQPTPSLTKLAAGQWPGYDGLDEE
jgi:soluble lytic murein transglycosylase